MLGWWRGYRRKSDAMQTGVRVLLLCKLEQMQREMVANDGIADNTAKRTAQLVYDSYHSLGGNGHGTQVNQDIQDAPIAPKEGLALAGHPGGGLFHMPTQHRKENRMGKSEQRQAATGPHRGTVRRAARVHAGDRDGRHGRHRRVRLAGR